MLRLPTLPVLVLAALPGAFAQDEGCTSSSPCPWEVDVDGSGFSAANPEPSWNFTAGDWFTLAVFNLDDAAHEVFLVSDDGTVLASLEVPALDGRSLRPLRLEAGSYELQDEPSGDAAPVEVVPFDVVEGQEEGGADPGAAGGSGGPGIPGFPLPWTAFALLAAAAWVRRK